MDEIDFDSSDYYISKQLGWVEFNKRVLAEAQDSTTPLLERFKYLSIVASNLDEFVMVRVARLKEQMRSGYSQVDNAGLTPQQIFIKLTAKIHNMVENQYQCFEKLLVELAKEGVSFINYQQLNQVQQRYLTDYFRDTIRPVLTPTAVDESRPFPRLLNKSLNLGVRLKSDEGADLFPNKRGQELFAVVRVPAILPRLVKVPGAQNEILFIFLEELIEEYLEQLFVGYEIESVTKFRITRNADVNLDEDARNLLAEMEEYLKRRKRGFPVRLEIQAGGDMKTKELLMSSLNLSSQDVYEIEGPIDLTPFFDFVNLEGYQELTFTPLPPQPASDFYQEENIFTAIKKRDRLVHHPYESFDPVLELIKEAANDPQVLAIKQTLYRVSDNSPVVDALAEAADNGKQVTALIELKARFDEKNNIEWARKLEQAGCHVIYGLIGLKVHAKLLLIIRQEEDGIRRYMHLSTGNYNEETAQLYTDVGMFTCKESFGADISSLFNLLTGYSAPPQWKKIAVAPLNLRKTFIELIDNEIESVKAGGEGHIIAKMNSLVDQKIIKALYKASAAGVKIDLIVRGMCSLRPGIDKVSENIRVTSIVGRYLEHSRIYYFANAGAAKIFLTSADWRPRNLERRVEALFPVEEEQLKERLMEILKTNLQDTVKARELQADGSYKRVSDDNGDNSQLTFYKLAQLRIGRLIKQQTKRFATGSLTFLN
ncbi:RNA degradosome polyphosphate kinase [Fuchsiella alkaliacetigena]|uniref:RNA degradosome polyphosphate kinase n=1 Tax=Fuchsiella alkaliacetigena TaxID=957042 RepID=UPI00200B70AC|nr:RNA degradosome polyphosphate kinase [Fuchsiella alkaliacetigena]MCK8824666.1 RNA degradosome polyphosphate kinase [Fuchsiella alkaliacetigena]